MLAYNHVRRKTRDLAGSRHGLTNLEGPLGEQQSIISGLRLRIKFPSLIGYRSRDGARGGDW